MSKEVVGEIGGGIEIVQECVWGREVIKKLDPDNPKETVFCERCKVGFSLSKGRGGRSKAPFRAWGSTECVLTILRIEQLNKLIAREENPSKRTPYSVVLENLASYREEKEKYAKTADELGLRGLY
jgi:hypothetical protein